MKNSTNTVCLVAGNNPSLEREVAYSLMEWGYPVRMILPQNESLDVEMPLGTHLIMGDWGERDSREALFEVLPCHELVMFHCADYDENDLSLDDLIYICSAHGVKQLIDIRSMEDANNSCQLMTA